MVHMPQMFRGSAVNLFDAARVNVSARELERFGLQSGDLLFARRSLSFEGAGLCAIVSALPEQATFESSIIRVRLNRDILLPEFALIFLRSEIGFSRRRGLIRQVAVSGVSAGDLASISIDIPTLREQRRIIEISSAVDEAIERTEALVGKLRQMKSGLMHDLFTRGVTPDGNLRPTRDEAPQLYQDSPLGRIPKEWIAKPLRHFVPAAVYGISVSMDDNPAGIPVLRMNNINQGSIEVSDIKFCGAIEARSLLLKAGDVLFNRTNSLEHVGKTAIWRNELPAASFASYLVRLDVDATKMRPSFLSHWLNLPNTQLTIRRFATPGVHQVNINPTNLRRIDCAAPIELAEQDRITSRIDDLDTLVTKHKAHLAKLRQQKQGLMHDLLTGKVRTG